MKRRTISMVCACSLLAVLTNLTPLPAEASAPKCFGKTAKIVGDKDGNGTIDGTPGNDVIVGTNGDDVIFGLGGNDRICGRAGSDTIDAGEGNDKVSGKAGADEITGGPGDDLLLGGDDADILIGGASISTPCTESSVSGCDQVDGGDPLFSPGDTCDAELEEACEDDPNQTPIATDDEKSTVGTEPITFPATDLLANDSDGDGDALSVTAVGDASGGTVVLNGADITYTPDPFPGPFAVGSFEYTLSDGSATDTGTVTVTFKRRPDAVNDQTSTNEDAAKTLSTAALLANDSDADGDPLSVTDVSNPTNGSVSLGGGGSSVTFTPDADYHGDGTFDYTVSDGEASDTAEVTITITSVNDVPEANVDQLSTDEDTAITFPASDLVANDTDIDADSLTVTAVKNPTSGTVVLNGGDVTYTPAADYSGLGTFDYTVSDGSATDTGEVAITITEVNDAPVAVDDHTSTTQDTPITFPASDLVANDTDAEGDALVVTAVSNASSGSVVLDGANITYTPENPGAQTFEYTVSDGSVNDTGQVTVYVFPPEP